MLTVKIKGRALPLPALLLGLALCGLVFTQARAASQKTPRAATPPSDQPKDGEDQPAYHEYKGVRIGMAADEARQKLGNPTDKGDTQDFYVLNDNETVQVFYDGSHKVTAVSVSYLGDVSKAPACKAVLGAEVEAGADGRVYKLVRYPKAGYWVSYSRTGGDSPMVTVVMQKL